MLLMSTDCQQHCFLISQTLLQMVSPGIQIHSPYLLPAAQKPLHAAAPPLDGIPHRSPGEAQQTALRDQTLQFSCVL